MRRALAATVATATAFALVAPVSTAMAASKPFAGQTLTVLYMESGTYDTAARDLAPAFERATGAKVVVESVPYAALYTKEWTSLLGGLHTYGVMSVASQWDGQFSADLTSLAPYIKKTPADAIGNFIPGVAKQTGIWGTKRFGIPMADDAYSVIVNTADFKQAHLRLNPNWTWSQYLADAKALTRNGVYGTSIAGAQSEQFSGYWSARYNGQGGHLLSPSWKPLPQAALAVKAMEQLKAAIKYMPPGIMSYTIPQQTAAFLQGKVAMAEEWPSFIRGVANNPSQSKVVDKWTILPYPGHHGQLSSWDLAVPNAAPNKSLAWAWIRYYTSPQSQLWMFQHLGVGPTRTALYKNPRVLRLYPGTANVLKGLMGAKNQLRFPAANQAWTDVNNAVGAYLTGQTTASAAVKHLIQEWTQIITKHPPAPKYQSP